MKRRWIGTGVRRWLLSLLPVATSLTIILLAGCGQATPTDAYLWTDAQHLVTLTWDDQNGTLSGQYTSISYTNVTFPTATSPDIVTIAYTGIQVGNVVTLDIGSSEQVKGSVSAENRTLAVAFVDPASGQILHQTWVAVTAGEQLQLVVAFSAYKQVQGWLDVAERDATGTNAWSDPNSAYLAQMRWSVSEQQEELAAIQKAPQITTRCRLVARFAPIASSAFMLPVTAPQNGALHDAAMLIQVWQRAQRLHVPQITGLALPWVIAPPVYQHESERFAAFVARVQTAYRQDEATIQRLYQQDEQVAQQVTILGQGCPPSPA